MIWGRRVFHSVFPEFSEDSIEEKYIYSTRQSRRTPIRVVLTLGYICLLGNFVTSAPILTAKGLSAFNDAGVALMLVMGVYLYALRTEFYKRTPWLDFAIFVPVTIGMTSIADILGSQEATGWPPITVLTGNAQLIMPFAVLCFVASTRWMLLWAIFELSVYTVDALFIVRSTAGLTIGITGLIPSLIIAFYVNLSLDLRARELFTNMLMLDAEKAKTENLLYNVLPKEVAQKLRSGTTVADAFPEATVVFLDLVDSSHLAKSLSPTHFVSVLNRFFLLADHCAERFGVEKVKTIGDAYLAVTGTLGPGGAVEALAFAREVILEIDKLAKDVSLDLCIRVGIHTGSVIGGVIGELRVAYDYWGDTMNVASRIQSVAEINGIAVSRQTYYLTRYSQPYRQPRIVTLKGVGELEVFDADIPA